MLRRDISEYIYTRAHYQQAPPTNRPVMKALGVTGVDAKVCVDDVGAAGTSVRAYNTMLLFK